MALLERLSHLVHERRLRQSGPPLREGLEGHVGLGVVHVLDVAPLGPPGLGHDEVDLGDLQEDLLRPLRDGEALVEGRARDVGDPVLDRPLLEGRHELRPQEREGGEACDEEQHGQAEEERLVAETPRQRPLVRGPDRAQEEGLVLAAGPQEEARQRRDDGEGEDQGAEHGEAHGHGHRLEELALDARQGEERQEHDDDDQDREGDGVRHLARGLEDRRVPRAPVGPAKGDHAKAVLDHDHRAVHHHADPDGEAAERHEVGGEPRQLHQDEGDEHGEGDGRGHHQRRAHLAQEEEQDDDDEHPALQERALGGADRLLDEAGLVVEALDDDPARQRLLRHLRPAASRSRSPAGCSRRSA